MNNSPDQKISQLTSADLQRLNQQRSVCTQYLADDASKANYQNSSAGKLGLLRALLQANIFSASHTYELQCMGVILGDVFVAELQMEWVVVEDEFGRDLAVRVPGTSILLFPLTMISKRVEQKKPVDVFDMFNSIAEQIDRLRSDPGTKS
jgi:hypothetical protein